MHRFVLRNQVLRFAGDTRGNVALLLGLLAVPLVSAVGLSVDYARAVAHQNRLESSATASTLAGMDMMRAMLAADPNVSLSKVKAASEDATQKLFLARKPAEVDVSVQSVDVSRDGDVITAKIAYAAKSPTTFAGLINMPTMDVSGSATSVGPTAAGAAQPSGDPNVILEDNFRIEQPPMNGAYGVVSEYNGWRLPSEGLEMNAHPIYSVPPPPGGGLVVELDNTKNGAMARKIYLSSGTYDLRYYVRDRVSYPAYDPVQLCGIEPGEFNWATATGTIFGSVIAPQSNRIGVYLERVASENPPAVFPGKSSEPTMIDSCISTGGRWIERRVRVVVDTPGFFWLAFQGEGPADGYGGLLGGIKMCRTSCTGANAALMESFPWTANQTLFEDPFNTPTPKGGGLNTTLDVSGSGSAWTTAPPRNWVTTPINQVDHQTFKMNGVDMMGVELDGSYQNFVGPQSGEPSANRGIHRRFLLAPGLYLLSFVYTTGAVDSTTANGVFCGLAQEQSNVSVVGTATSRLRVYMDDNMLHSFPSQKTGLGSDVVWYDGNGGPPNSPRIGDEVVHSCVYASSPTEQRVYLRVYKSANYWLTLAADDALATSDQRGPIVSQLKLTAVGGRSTADPSGYTSVPVKYRGRLLNTVRDGYYVAVTSQ